MAYTSEFIQVVFGGNIDAGADVDVWQCGLKIPVDPSFLQGDIPMQQFLDDCTADVQKWWTAVSGQYAPQTSLAFVKANVIGTNGRYKNGSKSFRKDFAERPGTSAQPTTLPGDVAVAVTLLTSAQRGLASKGRIYLPAPSVAALANNGRISVDHIGTLRTATATLIADLGNAPGIDGGEGIGDVNVMSDVREGQSRKVTGIKIGDLWDTQRRRTNKHKEVYSAVTPIP